MFKVLQLFLTELVLNALQQTSYCERRKNTHICSVIKKSPVE